jgi:hypothetical protein
LLTGSTGALFRKMGEVDKKNSPSERRISRETDRNDGPLQGHNIVSRPERGGGESF